MSRKQSLSGPLLLILLGTLLLVRNFSPDFPFWELVGRYWPLLLVVWGVAKLAVAMRAPEPGAPAWRPSLTIGEFFLALMIVLVGLTASRWGEFRKDAWFLGIDWPWSRDFNFTQITKQEFQPKSTLRVENANGDVRITGFDNNQITVTFNKSIRAATEEDAKALNSQFQPKLLREGTTYVISVPGYPHVRADVEISIPRAVPLRLEVRRGSVSASNVEGNVSAEMDRGDASFSAITGDVKLQIRRGSVSAQNIKGNVEIEGRGGDIQVGEVTGHLVVRGDYGGSIELARIAQGVRFSSSRTEMEIQKLPGRLDMTIGSLAISEPGGLVSINTRDKDIRIEEFPEKVQIVSRGASVELRTSKLPLKDIQVENHSGPIEVSIPARSDFQIEAIARRGEVESEFGELEVERRREKSRDSWIRGKVGSAAAQIKLDTSYGTIVLKKLGEAAEPAEPRVPVKPRRPQETHKSREPREVRNSFDDWPLPPAKAVSRLPRLLGPAKLPKLMRLPPPPHKSGLRIN